jgi:divalent metal cation (Fe/Co/Zn/Cd) transporter
VMTSLGTAAIGISVLLGTQVLVAGIALIILAVIKKKVGGVIRDKVESLKK